VAMQDLQS